MMNSVRLLGLALFTLFLCSIAEVVTTGHRQHLLIQDRLMAPYTSDR